MLVPFGEHCPLVVPSVLMAPGSFLVGAVSIGRDSSVWFGAVLRADIARIRVGERTNIQDGTVVHVSHGIPAEIGDDVTIGHRCVIHGATIGNAALVGMGSVVLDGAVIGDESIVGAGSLVTKGKVFPPRSLIMGSPAVLVRDLSAEEVASLYSSAARYVELKGKYRSAGI